MDQARSPAPPSSARRACPRSCRRDGWTATRQLTFLSELARTGSVTRAARAAGMSRESAYRLRKRDPHGLFAAAWDRSLKTASLGKPEGHKARRSTAARKRQERRKTLGFPGMSMKSHKLYDPLFAPTRPAGS